MAEEKDKSNHNADIGEAEGELAMLKKERDEYLDGWQRAKADLINYKKDEMKRFEMFARLANEELVRELIIILDSFGLAILAIEGQKRINPNSRAELATGRSADQGADLHGLYLIKSQLEVVLKKFGLQKIPVSIGEQFDPAKHEAISVFESDKPSGTIIEEIESGYMLNGKLIRPARVKVAK